MDLIPKPGGSGLGNPKMAQQAASATSAARRTKKRPSYGIRTVELTRGQLGFGFTLSGQGPCILSNIVAESPAARAMLRSGDHVIAVNGKNVSKCGHDDVVKLIGNSTGLLKLQIAESYCSNSSSEDEQVNRKFEKTVAQAVVHHHHHHLPLSPIQHRQDQAILGYVSDEEEYTLSPGAVLPPPPLPRPFHMRGNSADSTLTESSVLHPYQRPKRPSPRKRPAKQQQPSKSSPAKPTLTPSKSASNLRRIELHGSDELQLSEQDFHAFVHPTLKELRKSIKLQNTAKHEAEVTSAILKSVVGYLGTIEMPPKDGVTGLTAIRNCIRRLRVEKKVHTMVLMCILPDKIVLINHHGFKLAEYPSDRVTFCGMYMDDKRFFGLVTSQQIEEDDEENVDGASIVLASSCHVFMTEPLNDQQEMNRRARAFQFEPTPSPHTPGEFEEFPPDARPIIRTVMSVYGKDQEREEEKQQQQPVNEDLNSASSNSDVRSGTSSSTNSDSGIGYRDDADNILLMDPQSPPVSVQQQQQHLLHQEHLAGLEVEENVANEEKERFDVRAMPPPKDLATLSPEPGGASGGSLGDESFNTEVLDSQHSADNLRQSMQKYLQSKQDHLKKSSQQLLDNRPNLIAQTLRHQLASKPRLVTPTSSSASSTRDGGRNKILFSDVRPLASSSLARTSSDRSSVRSLEDVRFEKSSDFSPPPSFKSSDIFAIPSGSSSVHYPTSVSSSLLMNSASPLARFLYNSETNLSQLADSQMSVGRDQPLLSLMPGRGILRPCDQYPSEPGVLNSRPVSVLSGYGGAGGHGGSTASRNGDDFPDDIDGDDDDNGFIIKGSDSRGWSRGSSLRKHLRSRRSFSSSRIDQVGQQQQHERNNSVHKGSYGEDVTITDEVDPEVSSQTGSLAGSERGIDIGRVGSWATDFEKLLADPIGLRTFAEFLKKEFSHENIYFWTACERYRRLGNDSSYEKRRRVAGDIIRRHLASGAPEPVNVDSHARQAAIDGLESAAPGLFATSQKQIYNLMKFDSFSRFLKSDLYKESLVAEMSGKPLRFDPSGSEADPDLDIGSVPLQVHSDNKASLGRKSKFDLKHRDSEIGMGTNNPTSEPSRRRSLLPSWNNLRGGSGSSKDRSKSKDRDRDLSNFKKTKEILPEQKRPEQQLDSQSSSHNTSNESEEGAAGCKLARVILPDKATTVVQTRSGETIRAMVARLLEKRALKYTSFDVFATDNAEKPLDLSDESTVLGCTEVRVEPRVLFRLELPSKKSIGVKAKPAKLVKDVLGPILSQYGWNLDMMTVRREGDAQQQHPAVELSNTVASIDNCRLVVLPKSSAEINSRVLEDLLRVKSTVERMNNDDDRRSTKSESSNGSSSTNNRKFLRNSSTTNLKQPKQSMDMEEKLAMPPPGMIPQARRLPQPPNKNPNAKQFQPFANPVTDDLYEGLKIAQRGRLEDQRGTEINFEMPEFLKRGIVVNKENYGPSPFSGGAPTRQSEPVMRRDVFPSSPHERHSTHGSSHHQFDYSMVGGRPSQDFSRHNESNFSNEGFLPSLQEADRFFGNGFGSNPHDDFSIMSSDSRLSFGMRQQPQHHPQLQQQLSSGGGGGHFQDPIYETLSSYKHDPSSRRWSSNVSTVSAPNLTSTGGMGHSGRHGNRGVPPPLPPKPRLMNMKPDSMFLPPHQQQQQHGMMIQQNQNLSSDVVGLTRTDERGYSVSFV